jgi:DNA primase
MAFIPEDKLLEIRDAAPIEEVVGQYVKLQQRGKNLVGLCPFHADTSPSFNVSPERAIFKCFGCGAGGNVFHFVMQFHRLSFPEAVEELARRYGIALSVKELGPEGSKQTRKRQVWMDLMAQAATFYVTTLNSPAGKAGREYLQKRGLSPEVIQAFGLGYAPPDWDALSRHLQGRGASLAAAQEVGLVVPRSQGGGSYDRFRDRIIFPILDRQGRPIAFGGRIVGEGEPKYLNSPESPIYSKGRNLYGLPQASAALRRDGVALVVEGYLDLLALRVQGIEPVLATLGTALTREQVRLLKNLVSRVVLVYDGDAAGAKAMRRAFPLFAQEGLAVRALALPGGMDPDDYARTHGVDLFRSPWDAAQPWFSYLLKELIAAHGLSIEGRVRISDELRPYFQAVADPVERSLWLKLAAERLGVEEAALARSLTTYTPISPGRLDRSRDLMISLERRIIKWILSNPKAVPMVDLEEWAEEFENQEMRLILDLIIAEYQQNHTLDHSLLVQHLEGDELRQQVCALVLGEEEFGGLDLLLADWRRALRVRRLEKARQALKERLAEVSAISIGEDLAALCDQKDEVERQLEALKKPAAQ